MISPEHSKQPLMSFLFLTTNKWEDVNDFIFSDIWKDFLRLRFFWEVDVNKGVIVLIIVVCVLILVLM